MRTTDRCRFTPPHAPGASGGHVPSSTLAQRAVRLICSNQQAAAQHLALAVLEGGTRAQAWVSALLHADCPSDVGAPQDVCESGSAGLLHSFHLLVQCSVAPSCKPPCLHRVSPSCLPACLKLPSTSLHSQTAWPLGTSTAGTWTTCQQSRREHREAGGSRGQRQRVSRGCIANAMLDSTVPPAAGGLSLLRQRQMQLARRFVPQQL